MESQKVTKIGTESAISLEEVSNVQQSVYEPNSLTNTYLVKVFNTVTKFYAIDVNAVKIEMQESSLQNLKDNKTTGSISAKTKKRVNRCLYAWSKIVQCYNNQNLKLGLPTDKHLIMITLTLPCAQLHDDKYIKRNLLGYFIEQLCRHRNLENYFWRAEVQVNNRIHFHFITDIYIPYTEIKKYWNHCLALNGYLDEYRRTTGREDPPSTHVKMISGSDDELYYSLKYTLKTEDKRPIEGYIFGYSDSLRNIYTPILKMTDNLNTILNKLEESPATSVITEEYYSTYFIKKECKPPKELNDLDTIFLQQYEPQVDILY
jgi:hypothetical protein